VNREVRVLSFAKIPDFETATTTCFGWRELADHSSQSSSEDLLAVDFNSAELSASHIVFVILKTEELQITSGLILLFPTNTSYCFFFVEGLNSAGFTVRKPNYSNPMRFTLDATTVNRLLKHVRACWFVAALNN